jgi:hypothetical protein
MFCPKKDEITEDGWSLNDEKLHDLYCSKYVAGVRIEMKLLDEAC